ncbi:hypothetical protein BN855_29850 [Salmonella enterica subsp. enterica serovar Bovismorbificans str. 3114]|nr:hypothetical protein BN855_29850 [Salmonella enterica subsp. enterica serovar Bovismorbificans str. 3114]
MSILIYLRLLRVPRASGDKPPVNLMADLIKPCSPRQRG